MKYLTKITTITLASLSLIATMTFGKSTQAQTYQAAFEQENQLISNGSRHPRNIEPEETFNLNFTTPSDNTSQNKNTYSEDYQIETQDSEIDLEAKDNEWGNRGDVEDHSIELEVHEFQ